MEKIENILGTDLIKRFDIPAYSLLDDIRYHGKFCPRNPKTGTPIPPPRYVREFKAIKKLEKVVQALESKKKEAAIELGLEAARAVPKIRRQAYARLKGVKADLDLFRSQLSLLTKQIDYPDRMWERYYPSNEEEKSLAIDILLAAEFWVRFAPPRSPVLDREDGENSVPQMLQTTTGEEARPQVLDMFGKAKSRGKELKPTIDDLYRLMLEVNRPLKETTRERLKNTAIEIFEDDPEKYDPITIAHLRDSGLYNTDAAKTRRDFCGKLIKKILKSEMVNVPNFEKLYSLIWNDHPED
ncbi:MAG: hypothetical protein ACLP2X_04180 [Syntrophobacteraceae bacterium]